MRRLLGVALLLGVWQTPALAQSNEEMQRRLGQLEQRLAQFEAQSQSQGLLSLLSQVEQLKSELARLRGMQEEQAHRLGITEKRQKDLYADLDARMKELASRPAAASASAPASAPVEDEAKVYQTAFEQIRLGSHKAAITAFTAFIKAYPNGSLASNAQYWIGFAHFSLGEFKEAIAAHQRLIQVYPDSAKVPDAMLGLGRAQMHLGDAAAGKATLEQIVAKYPATKAAENAGKLLAAQK